MHTLVVDDSQAMQVLLHHLLSFYGKCDISQNGQEAIDAHARGLNEGQPYDLICLDLGLPYFDGEAVLSKIRAAEALRLVPVKVRVIVVTATREPGREQEAYAFGADGFLVKPLVPQQLIQYLKEFGLLGRDHTTPTYVVPVGQVRQMCDGDQIPVAVLAGIIRSIANSIDRQSSDCENTLGG